MTYSIDDIRDAEWDYERDKILAEYDPDDLAEIGGRASSLPKETEGNRQPTPEPKGTEQ